MTLSSDGWWLVGGWLRLVASPLPAVGIWLLVGVFIWSGVVKVRHPRLAALAMTDFGVVRVPRRGYGLFLGSGELALALLLLVTSQAGLVIATGLLWVFTGAIARSLILGRRFSCFCFGDAEGSLSWSTLARTGLLAVLATLLLVGGQPGSLLRADWGGVAPPVIAAATLGLAALLHTVPTLVHLAPAGRGGSSRQGGMG